MEKSILEVAHESVADLYEIGLVDTATMREFDALCLPAIKEVKPKEIKLSLKKTCKLQPNQE